MVDEVFDVVLLSRGVYHGTFRSGETFLLPRAITLLGDDFWMGRLQTDDR